MQLFFSIFMPFDDLHDLYISLSHKQIKFFCLEWAIHCWDAAADTAWKAWAFSNPIAVFITEDEILLLFFNFRGMNRR
jgi:hypothetical protein